MVRGQRIDQLTKRELLQRLRDTEIEGSEFLREDKSSLLQLLGHCAFYGLVDEEEYNETLPTVESTQPCYLYTYIEDPYHRDQIDKYVIIFSELFRRGSYIFNMAAMDACGSRSPFAEDYIRPQRWRPQIEIESILGNERSSRFISWFMECVDGDVRSSTLKHVFLPERWPSSFVEREPIVQGILNLYNDTLPRLPQWQGLMSVSGWDNAVNRMATKYFSNATTRIAVHLLRETIEYFKLVRNQNLPSEDSVALAIKGPLRPWIMHQEDWEVMINIRKIFGIDRVVSPNSKHSHELPEDVVITRQVVALHIFISKNGIPSHPYFPVGQRSRKYAYIDTKIASHLFRRNVAIPSTSSTPHQSEKTLSVGELLGLTEAAFNAKRKALRRQLRREFRKKKRRETNGEKKKRFAKIEKKWSRMDCGKLPKGVRVDSIETDGVGLRMCLKTPIDQWDKYHVEIPPIPIKVTKKKKEKHSTPPPYLEIDKENGEHMDPLFCASDTGLAKPFTSAISKSVVKKPDHYVFTRSRYYFQMGYYQNRKWEKDRMNANEPIRTAIELLSQSGGINNCDLATWNRFFMVERNHREILHNEFVLDKNRSLWKMRTFRRKRSSLDRAIQELLTKSTQGEPITRPLVFGVGNASFKASMKGSLPAPTTTLALAFKKGLRNLEKKTGRKVIITTPYEGRTTKCCCACGEETRFTRVQRRNKEGVMMDERSRRLRTCINCEMEGKVRDRDIQASRNILWLTIHWYYGLDRPQYLCRQ
jgi:hypothetical protein